MYTMNPDARNNDISLTDEYEQKRCSITADALLAAAASRAQALRTAAAAASRVQALHTAAAASRASSAPGVGKQAGSGNPPFRHHVGKASSAPGFVKKTGSGNPPFRHHAGLKKTVQPPSLVATLVYGVLGMFSLMMLCIVGVCLDMGLQIGMMIIVYFICNYMYGRGYFPFLYRKPMNQIPCTGCRVKNCGFLHVTD